MKVNACCMDMILRIIAGARIIAPGIYFKSLWGALGTIPIYYFENES